MSHRKFTLVNLVTFCFSLILVSSAIAEEQRYIVVFKDKAKKNKMVRKADFKKARHFDIIPAMSQELTDDQVDELLQSSDVEFIEPDYPRYSRGFKDTPPTSVSASLTNRKLAASSNSEDSTISASSTDSQETPYGIDLVNAPDVWEMTKGSGAIIAVLDTGIAMYHPDAGNIVGYESFVDDEEVEDFEGHGTHVSGTIAAADNEIGVVGIAPEAGLLIGKVLDNEGSGYTSDVIAGIEWAVENGADVISMSLGSSSSSTAEEAACQEAYEQGVLVVAAAGNEADEGNPTNYPAAYDSVVAVAAVDSDSEWAYYSNYGSYIEIAAPGTYVYSTVPVSDYAETTLTANGTSYDSTRVVGSAAGTVTGTLCDCGLATGDDEDNTCPDSVEGNIALIRRGSIYFSEKVAHAEAKGAAGVIISNNTSTGITATLATGTPLVTVFISETDGDTLEALAASSAEATITLTDDLYEYYSGTSMATPHVAGVAALIIAAQGEITPDEVREILSNTSEDLGDSGWDQYYGYGLVDAQAAFEYMEPLTCQAVHTLGYAYPGDVDINCTVDIDDLSLLATQWLDTDCSDSDEWCYQTDIDQSNSVTLNDYIELAAQWLLCNDPEDEDCSQTW